MKKTMTKIDIGLTDKQRKEIVAGLSHLLADTYTLYLKTHNYHWNVVGPHFSSLHLMFETQYNEIWQAVDEIAERIRALGHKAPASYKEFATLTKIKDATGNLNDKAMVADLVKGHERVTATARGMLKTVEAAGDQPTLDLLTRRMEVHEKTAWMLRSINE